jgi:phosphatidylglycerophosphate synthase
MSGVAESIRRVYRESRKDQDIAWNRYAARPVAAVVVYVLARTKLTPNQVTFLGGALFLVAAAALIALPGPSGFLVGALLVQASYVLDCADGQLARLKQMTSEVGAHLDFLMDEIKALALVGACGVRLWLLDGEAWWLLGAVGAVALVSIATSLTNFVRRPEYAGRAIGPGESARKRPIPASIVGKLLWLAEGIARYFIHYPSWILWVALIGFLAPVDTAILFLAPFLGVYLLYLTRTGLQVVLRLGSPSFYR